jgi:hypothetical protein
VRGRARQLELALAGEYSCGAHAGGTMGPRRANTMNRRARAAGARERCATATMADTLF